MFNVLDEHLLAAYNGLRLIIDLAGPYALAKSNFGICVGFHIQTIFSEVPVMWTNERVKKKGPQVEELANHFLIKGYLSKAMKSKIGDSDLLGLTMDNLILMIDPSTQVNPTLSIMIKRVHFGEPLYKTVNAFFARKVKKRKETYPLWLLLHPL